MPDPSVLVFGIAFGVPKKIVLRHDYNCRLRNAKYEKVTGQMGYAQQLVHRWDLSSRSN